MSKKSRRAKQRHQTLAQPPSRIVEQQISHANHQILQGDFTGTIETCKPLLSHLPRRSAQRVEVLALLGLAHGMLQHYQESYNIFSEAVTIDPTSAQLWYNRGLASRYTTRLGQAVRDFERAVELSRNDTGELARKFAAELQSSRKQLQEAMQEHKVPITLDEYIQQEERFMQAMNLMRNSRWKEAELAFRQIIEIGGTLPQYWGNLGTALVMQARYEEAEAALKHALEIDPEYAIARDNLEKLPDIQRVGGPLGVELRELVPSPDIAQSITFYGKNSDSPVVVPTTAHTRIEKSGDVVKGTRKPLGKQPPRYSFFLNPYKDVRFTTCPKCGNKTRQRKLPLVIHVDPIYSLTLNKTCRYCVNCDLLIAHQDQLEEFLAGYFSTVNPEVIGNDYLVMGTLDKPEWKKGMEDQLSVQEMLEHLHDFLEVVTFKRAYA